MGCMLVPLLASLAGALSVFATPDLTVARFERRTDVVLAFGLLAVAAISTIATSNLIVPLLALAFAMGASGPARPGRRRPYLLMGLAAFLVPFGIEWLGIAPDVLPGLQVTAQGVLFPGAASKLPALPLHLVVLVGTCVSLPPHAGDHRLPPRSTPRAAAPQARPLCTRGTSGTWRRATRCRVLSPELSTG